LGPGHRIVTILCDSGARHLSKFYNDEWLKEQGIEVLDGYDNLSFLNEAQNVENILKE
jgi:cysteine synthase A